MLHFYWLALSHYCLAAVPPEHIKIHAQLFSEGVMILLMLSPGEMRLSFCVLYMPWVSA